MSSTILGRLSGISTGNTKNNKRNTRRRSAALAAAVAGLGLWAGQASAAIDSWTGGADANWDTATNWSLSAKPVAANDVVFPFAIPATGSTITLGASELANSLTFHNSYILTGGDVTLTTNNVTIDGLYYAPYPGSTATPTNTTTISSAVKGTAGLTLNGQGQLTLNGSAVNTFTGGLVINGGTVLLDNTHLASATNLVNSGNQLVLDGGTLRVSGNSSAATSQTFNGTMYGQRSNGGNAAGFPSQNRIVVTDPNGMGTVVNLGAITHSGVTGYLDYWSTLDISLPAGTQSATNGVTTSTGVLNASGIMDPPSPSAARPGPRRAAATSSGSPTPATPPATSPPPTPTTPTTSMRARHPSLWARVSSSTPSASIPPTV